MDEKDEDREEEDQKYEEEQEELEEPVYVAPVPIKKKGRNKTKSVRFSKARKSTKRNIY